jgi:subtilase family serine protease
MVRHGGAVLRRVLVLVGAVLPLAVVGMAMNPATASAGANAGAGAARSQLAGSRPQWAASARALSAVPASATVQVRVYLSPKVGEKALRAAVAAVSTPGSAQFRHFITPGQYRAQYGPSASAISSVSAWLAGAGMKVAGIDKGDRYVGATGTAATAERAFGVQLNLYREAGRIQMAPSTDASVPAAVSASVLGVTGLSSPTMVKPAIAPPPGFRNARPCSAFYGQLMAKRQEDGSTPLPKFDGKYRAYAVCGYNPQQFRSAYGVTASGLTGQGTTVAITDAYASSTIKSDANTYAKRQGDAAFASGQFTQVSPGGSYRKKNLCAPDSWLGEETLDVEAVHGIATDANVMYYPARSCFDNDLQDALSRVVDQNQASVVTNSWGEPGSGETSGSIAAYEQIFLQGAMQGIGFLFSSGDFGDELANTGQIQTDYPTSDPYVTSVGGASTGIGSDGTLTLQTGWGTDHWNLSQDGSSWVPRDPLFQYGAGGGFSSLFNRPAYQDGVVPPKSPAGRAVPDVALDADPNTGMLIGETQTFPDGVYYDQYRIGGTSLASPLMAGMQALATQNAGERLGFANPAIYALALNDPSAYDDILSSKQSNVRSDYANGIDPSGGYLYSVRTFDQDSSLVTKPGWDDVTGIGQPNDQYLMAFGS